MKFLKQLDASRHHFLENVGNYFRCLHQQSDILAIRLLLDVESELFTIDNSGVTVNLWPFYKYLWCRLHHFHWFETSEVYKELFTALSVFVIVVHGGDNSSGFISTALQIADTGLLLGSHNSLYAEKLHEVIADMQLEQPAVTCVSLRKRKHNNENIAEEYDGSELSYTPHRLRCQAYLRRCCFGDNGGDNRFPTTTHRTATWTQASPLRCRREMIISAVTEPSILSFKRDYFDTQNPVVVRGALQDWPALQPAAGHSWADLDYIRRGR
jgi:hypothetical protein